MKAGSFVVVHLVLPREKFWGVLHEASPSGVTVRGIALDAFESWAREVARGGETSSFPATVFFPMHRVERVFADETSGEVASYAERFEQIVGEDVGGFLGR
ncbi:MAG: hypothetical protein ABJC28_04660 [Acidobacteriota bacterium]